MERVVLTDAAAQRFLAEASVVLASSLDYRATVASAARLAVPCLADWSVVDLRELDGSISRVAVAQAAPADPELERLMYHYVPRPELRRGVWRVMETGCAELLSVVGEQSLADTARDAEHLAFIRKLNIRSYLCVPLRARGQTLGTLMLCSAQPGFYTAAHLALAEDLACRAAFAVDNARLFQQAERLRADAEAQARRAELLDEASRVLSSALDSEASLSALATLAARTMADWCVVHLVDNQGVLCRLETACGDPTQDPLVRQFSRYRRLEGRAPLLTEVVRTGASQLHQEIDDELLVRYARDDGHLDLLRRVAPRSVIFVAMRARGRTLGVLAFATVGARRLGPADLTLAEDLAARAALAVDNARLYSDTLEASRSKDEFIATVSHELRTPLTALLLWAERLRTGGLDEPEQRRGLDVILSSARAQRRLIEDLLDMSGIVSGKLQLVTLDAPLAPLVRAAIDAVSPTADSKRVRLTAVVDPTIGSLVCDPDRIRQVLVNLLSNAIKFTPEGGEVTLEAVRKGALVELHVRDTGVGIPTELLPHVFERYRQGAESSQLGGLGLGLAIVKHLVERHGGKVRAHSKGRGAGAELVVSLPAREAPAVVAPLIEVVTPSPLTGLRVLLVDDDANIRELFADALECSGAQVVTAAGTLQAMIEIDERRPDVIVSDLAMPGEDGYSLIRRVRAHPHAGRVPAAAVSASATPEHRRRALEAGYQAHLVKPIEIGALVQLVADLGRPVA